MSNQLIMDKQMTKQAQILINLKKITITMFIINCITFGSFCYAYGDWDSLTKTQYNKWWNKPNRLVLPKNAILCQNPKTLAKLYNKIAQNGGVFNKATVYNTEGCELSYNNFPARIIKKFYNGKIVQIEYVAYMSLKYNYYALSKQLLTMEQIKKIYFVNIKDLK